jgi:hypothetical protein
MVDYLKVAGISERIYWRMKIILILRTRIYKKEKRRFGCDAQESFSRQDGI